MESGVPAPQGVPQQRSQVKYHFNVGSVDSFERKLDEAQVGLILSLPSQLVPISGGAQ